MTREAPIPGARLNTVLECFDEAALCLRRETFHQREYDLLVKQKPDQDAQLLLDLIQHYRERRQKAIARMEELQRDGGSPDAKAAGR